MHEQNVGASFVFSVEKLSFLKSSRAQFSQKGIIPKILHSIDNKLELQQKRRGKRLHIARDNLLHYLTMSGAYTCEFDS